MIKTPTLSITFKSEESFNTAINYLKEVCHFPPDDVNEKQKTITFDISYDSDVIYIEEVLTLDLPKIKDYSVKIVMPGGDILNYENK